MGGVGGQAVAVVGAACRLPGGIADLGALWAALDTGLSSVGEGLPEGFDAGYFGLTAHEAARLAPGDPVLLELVVEALDDAGLDGAGAGVYTGGGGHEAVRRHLGPGPGRSCPGSLAALERACRAVHDGEVRLALAAGVDIGPYGEAWSGGALVLKRLGDALAGRDRIHGVLAGWGSGPVEEQEKLVRELYERARVDPDELVYVEAGAGHHAALGRALAMGRETPLPVGEGPANGILAVVKAMLVLRHRRTPGSFGESVAAGTPGPALDGVQARLAPVMAGPAASGFVGVHGSGGEGGAHVIVAPAPADLGRVVRQRGALPVTVSARSQQALGEAVRRTAERLRSASPDEFYDLAYTSCARRSRHPYRRVVLADDPSAAARALAGGVRQAVRDGRVAFAYTGDFLAVARAGLPVDDRVFRSAVDRVDAALTPALGWSVRAALPGIGEGAPVPDLTGCGAAEGPVAARRAAVVFAVHVAVTKMLAARGIRPAAAFGQDPGGPTGRGGHLAAAWAAGRMTLEDVARALAAHPCAGSAASHDPPLGPVAGACRAVEDLTEGGVELFVEVGPGLGPVIRRSAPRPPVVVTVLAAGRDGVDEAAGELIEAGADADWDAVFPRPGRVAGLPAYPWQRLAPLPLARRSHHAG
ncbi:hypothetical protein [Nonomuraea sp. NPDC048826]|uniref:CurL C-terminal domain-containing protein n=1 Tax=Nonomuraea sp. NPDC048826 TaxID=3364347 RepID=UPI00370FC8F3